MATSNSLWTHKRWKGHVQIPEAVSNNSSWDSASWFVLRKQALSVFRKPELHYNGALQRSPLAFKCRARAAPTSSNTSRGRPIRIRRASKSTASGPAGSNVMLGETVQNIQEGAANETEEKRAEESVQSTKGDTKDESKSSPQISEGGTKDDLEGQTQDQAEESPKQVAEQVEEAEGATSEEEDEDSDEETQKGVTVASMMGMIKDAEKNVLLLNKVRVGALEELKHVKARAELATKEVLLLEARLNESEAQLKFLAQTQTKNQLLQEQIEALNAKLGEKDSELGKVQELEAERESARVEVEKVEKERESLQAEVGKLAKELEEQEKRVAELRQVEEDKQKLEETLRELSAKLGEAEEKVEGTARLAEEKEALQKDKENLLQEKERLKVELDAAQKQGESVKNEGADLQTVAADLKRKEKELADERERQKYLRLQLARLDALLSASAEVREKDSKEETAQLQRQFEGVQERLKVSEESLNDLRAERDELKVVTETLRKRVQKLENESAQVVELQAKLSQTESLLTEKEGELERTQQVWTQQERTKEERTKEERTEQERAKQEVEDFRKQKEDLQRKLDEAEGRLKTLTNELKEKALLETRVQDLEALLKAAGESAFTAKGEESMRSIASEKAQAELLRLHKQIPLLEASINELQAERDIWEEAQKEKALLQQQVALLKEQLVQSDVDMQAQLDLYKNEVESFQESLEQMRLEGARAPAPSPAPAPAPAPALALAHAPVPVGEMPWGFWSDLLLRIDALMLDQHLTLDQAVELRLMAWHRDSRIRDAYEGLEEASDVSATAGLLKLIKGKVRPGMHIVHIAAEMAPVAKVGGLADVVTGLGRALQKKGHLVEFVLPKYDCMDYSRVQDLKVLHMDLESFFDGQLHKNKLWRGIVEGLPVYFIEPHHPDRYFWRKAFYGESDDFKRFTYFCRAALEFIYKTGKKPDIIHCHDWQTALVAPLFWDLYAPRGMDSTQVAFTCHNFEYQGTESPGALASAGLDWREYYRQDRMQDNFMLDRINLLKGGVVYSNVVTTVSPTYSREVMGPEGGRGLHPTLVQHSAKFSGVLNGIDQDAWDPSTDPLLEYQYDAESPDAKYANKNALRKKLGLSIRSEDEGRPLVGCVTRLVPQKGVHLIRHAIYRTLEMGGQFILLGNSPVASIQRDFEGIARHFERSPHVRLILKYDEALSHMIYSASDMFVIPSMFEPCGLTQLISMRYGSIPIARKTGGLNDSVFDVDDKTVPEHKRNGFTFTATDEQGLNYALDRALKYYWEQPEYWRELVQKAMHMDWGWDGPSEDYLALYRKAIAAVHK